MRGLAVRISGQYHASPQKYGTNLPDFEPSRVHLLFQGVYGYHLHHNNGLHLDGVVAYNTVWKSN